MRKWKVMICVMLCLLTGCASTNAMGCKVKSSETLFIYKKYSRVIADKGFDTFIGLTAFTSEKEFEEYLSIVEENWVYLGQLFDIYHDYEGVNNIKTINDNAGSKAIEVDPIVIDMLDMAKEYYALTDGAFDVSMGSVLSLWHTYREEGIALNEQGKSGQLPSLEELEEASKYTGWDFVEIDHKAHTVYLSDEHVSLDVGGIAKGYAAEYIANKLECAGMRSGFINAGGNIRTIGSNKEAMDWSFGIVNPNDMIDGDAVDALNYTESVSVVTSGDYQRYYMVDGTRYAHIISPYTLYPATTFRAVTIATSNSAVADILSTALFSMSYEDGIALSEKLGVDVIWMCDDGNGLEGSYYAVVSNTDSDGSLRVVYNGSSLEHSSLYRTR